MAEVHKMFLEGPRVNGTWVWACPTCGRRLAVSNTPNFSREVLADGNADAVHVAVANTRPMITNPPIRVQESDVEWLASVGIAWE